MNGNNAEWLAIVRRRTNPAPCHAKLNSTVSNPRPAFHHPKRPCMWCDGMFKPVDTISGTTTEHFCSTECALARHQARALDLIYPGALDTARVAAVAGRRAWSTEVAQRLQAGREQAKQDHSHEVPDGQK